MILADDGQGMAADRREGTGLTGMRERITALGTALACLRHQMEPRWTPARRAGGGRRTTCMRHAPIVPDISLPGKGGLDLAAPDATILIHSMKDQTGVAARAMRAGAIGLLSRNAAPEDFGAATRQLEADEFYLPPKQAVALMTLRAGASAAPLSAIGDRERQVRSLIGRGMWRQTSAEDLGVCDRTAASTLSSLKTKPGVERIKGLMKFALESGV